MTRLMTIMLHLNDDGSVETNIQVRNPKALKCFKPLTKTQLKAKERRDVILKQLDDKKVSINAIAKLHGISRGRIYQILRKIEDQNKPK